jgi:hypothetical protein
MKIEDKIDAYLSEEGTIKKNTKMLSAGEAEWLEDVLERAGVEDEFLEMSPATAIKGLNTFLKSKNAKAKDKLMAKSVLGVLKKMK